MHFFDNDAKHINELKWYEKHMPKVKQGEIVIEETPNYIESPKSPERVYHMNRKTNIIVMLRDPVQRAISNWVDTKEKGRVLGDIEHSFFMTNGSVNSQNKMIKRGMYYEQLERWYRFFPKDQVLLLDAEVFIRNPILILNSVEQFLGVETYTHRRHLYFDRVSGLYCKKKPNEAKCMSNKRQYQPYIEEEALKKLYDYYRPYNKMLQKLTGQYFTFMMN